MKLQLSFPSWDQKFVATLMNQKSPVDSFFTRLQKGIQNVFSFSGPKFCGSPQELTFFTNKLVTALSRPEASLLTCNAELSLLVASLKKAIAGQGKPLSVAEQGQVLKALITQTSTLSKEKQQEVFRTIDELYQISFFDKHKERIPFILSTLGTMAAAAIGASLGSSRFFSGTGSTPKSSDPTQTTYPQSQSPIPNPFYFQTTTPSSHWTCAPLHAKTETSEAPRQFFKEPNVIHSNPQNVSWIEPTTLSPANTTILQTEPASTDTLRRSASTMPAADEMSPISEWFTRDLTCPDKAEICSFEDIQSNTATKIFDALLPTSYENDTCEAPQQTTSENVTIQAVNTTPSLLNSFLNWFSFATPTNEDPTPVVSIDARVALPTSNASHRPLLKDLNGISPNPHAADLLPSLKKYVFPMSNSSLNPLFEDQSGISPNPRFRTLSSLVNSLSSLPLMKWHNSSSSLQNLKQALSSFTPPLNDSLKSGAQFSWKERAIEILPSTSTLTTAGMVTFGGFLIAGALWGFYAYNFIQVGLYGSPEKPLNKLKRFFRFAKEGPTVRQLFGQGDDQAQPSITPIEKATINSPPPSPQKPLSPQGSPPKSSKKPINSNQSSPQKTPQSSKKPINSNQSAAQTTPQPNKKPSSAPHSEISYKPLNTQAFRFLIPGNVIKQMRKTEQAAYETLAHSPARSLVRKTENTQNSRKNTITWELSPRGKAVFGAAAAAVAASMSVGK